MRVFLAAQILSSSLHELLRQFIDGNEQFKIEYLSLMLIISKLDRLIDTWDHPDSKEMVYIDCVDYEYINELKSILLLFTKWRDVTTVAKKSWEGFSTEIYNDLCWTVYGMKGISSHVQWFNLEVELMM